jgi:hypothetical protein
MKVDLGIRHIDVHGSSNPAGLLINIFSSDVNSWIAGCRHMGSWRSLHGNNFPEKELEEILSLWQRNKESLGEASLPDGSFEDDDKRKSTSKRLIYSQIIEPTVDKICTTLDELILKEQNKCCVFASWIYTYGVSRLELKNQSTRLEQELEKRFENINIAPKTKHCCQGLCSACGTHRIAYSLSDPRQLFLNGRITD